MKSLTDFMTSTNFDTPSAQPEKAILEDLESCGPHRNTLIHARKRLSVLGNQFKSNFP